MAFWPLDVQSGSTKFDVVEDEPSLKLSVAFQVVPPPWADAKNCKVWNWAGEFSVTVALPLDGR